jgi:hypothetical protein
VRLYIIGIFIIVVCCVLLSWYPKETANKEDAVTPVPATLELQGDDHIIPEYIESVHQQQTACDELAATAERLESTAQECMKTLRQCTDMLKANYLIPKRTTEKETP